jgi:hypothetical protein
MMTDRIVNADETVDEKPTRRKAWSTPHIIQSECSFAEANPGTLADGEVAHS